MPSDTTFKFLNSIHRAVFNATKGRILGKFFGMPVIALTTTGRKSGQPRTAMLTCPIAENGTFVVVGSRGGDPKHPAWVHNIKANGDVDVLYEGRTRKMRARVLSSQERAELWPRVVAQYKGYGEYQKKAGREIPLVIIEPA